MRVAVEGCSHGELDVIYSSITKLQETSGVKIDLLICCGDFQSVRNVHDLKCMAVPTKYMNMQSFYKYYSGEAVAPVLTIFIGGNHEASNYLQELPYGGWVAPNIYYLGYGGVVNVGGLRIGGISGIYKGPDYLKGRYELPAYNDSSIRSVYHVRNLEVFRMKQLAVSKDTPIDIMLSHDWPRGVTKYGNANELCSQKPFFKEEVESESLGSRAAQELLHFTKPRYWFSGHLHVKFAAIVPHAEADDTKDSVKDSDYYTRFLALDKCLPRREFLQVMNIKPNRRRVSKCGTKTKLHSGAEVPMFNEEGFPIIYHDLEWLTVLRLTNHLLKVTKHAVYMPGPGSSERYNFTPSEEDLDTTLQLLGNNLAITGDSFSKTVDAFNPRFDSDLLKNISTVPQPSAVLNPHTIKLCESLEIDEPVAILLNSCPKKSTSNFLLTPRRQPSSTEMNVTLDSSRQVEGGSGSEEESGDIVFEVSIGNQSDGTSIGFLSPALASDENKEKSQSSKACKSLQLGASALASPNSGSQGSPVTKLSSESSEASREEATSGGGKSVMKPLRLSAPLFNEGLAEKELKESLEEKFNDSSSPKRQISDDHSIIDDNSIIDDHSISPKRPKVDDDYPDKNDCNNSEAPVKKSLKIKRRNVDMYQCQD